MRTTDNLTKVLLAVFIAILVAGAKWFGGAVLDTRDRVIRIEASLSQESRELERLDLRVEALENKQAQNKRTATP